MSLSGLSTNAKTKDDFLNKACQARIRGYFYKAKDQLTATKLTSSSRHYDQTVKMIMSQFSDWLKDCSYNGHYFDRRFADSKQQPKPSICDSFGNFLCEGKFNQICCKYILTKAEDAAAAGDLSPHQINPYASPEARIMFSTWNFDHV